MKKIIFFVIWFAFLALVPLTILKSPSLATSFKYPVNIVGLVLRICGLTAYILLFVQIILGAFMDKLEKKIGPWILKFHSFEGGLAYFFIFSHALLFVVVNYFAGGKIDPYVAFINICLMCKTRWDLFVSFGRISFWLITIAVLTAVFNKATSWLKKNWRKMHLLNYVIFLLIGAHGFFVGADFKIQPFYTFAVAAYIAVLGIIVFYKLPLLFKDFKAWLRS